MKIITYPYENLQVLENPSDKIIQRLAYFLLLKDRSSKNISPLSRKKIEKKTTLRLTDRSSSVFHLPPINNFEEGWAEFPLKWAIVDLLAARLTQLIIESVRVPQDYFLSLLQKPRLKLMFQESETTWVDLSEWFSVSCTQILLLSFWFWWSQLLNLSRNCLKR